MASDNWVKDLLADVARETRIEVDNLMRLGSNREILAEVLERRLLPLLIIADENAEYSQDAKDEWDAAKAAAMKEATDGER